MVCAADSYLFELSTTGYSGVALETAADENSSTAGNAKHPSTAQPTAAPQDLASDPGQEAAVNKIQVRWMPVAMLCAVLTVDLAMLLESTSTRKNTTKRCSAIG